MSKKKKVDITPEIMDRVKSLPEHCLGVQSDVGFVEIGIKIFFIIRIIIRALADGKIKFGEITNVWDAISNKMKVNHVFRYWGGSNFETVDAIAIGVRKSNLIKKIEQGSKIKLFYNKNAKPANIAIAKAYSYGTVGRMYGYLDFAAFVTDLIKTVKPNIPTINASPYMDHCSENSAVTEDLVLTGNPGEQSKLYIPEVMDRAKVHPQNTINYVESKKGIKAGYVLADSFNC